MAHLEGCSAHILSPKNQPCQMHTVLIQSVEGFMQAGLVRDSCRQTWLELHFKLMRTGAVVREVNKAVSWHHGRVARGILGSGTGFEYQLSSQMGSP